MRFMLIALTIALLAATAATLAGLAAPMYPAADMINHFRPLMLVAAGALLALAVLLRARRRAWACAALAGVNAVLLVLPLLWSADAAERSTAGQALASSGARDLKLVTFNMAFRSGQAAVRFLQEEDPDLAVLQEAGRQQAAQLHTGLIARYPHILACPPGQCEAIILSKRPWAASGHANWTVDSPETLWVQFDDKDYGRLKLVSVHLSLPFHGETQSKQITRLTALRESADGALIIAGDFNMTPWSYRQQRLLAATGLRRHATFLRSWPTDGQYRLPAPTFLIDHVLTTPEIKSVSIRIGPMLGSDHLPVVAVLRMPGRGS